MASTKLFPFIQLRRWDSLAVFFFCFASVAFHSIQLVRAQTHIIKISVSFRFGFYFSFSEFVSMWFTWYTVFLFQFYFFSLWAVFLNIIFSTVIGICCTRSLHLVLVISETLFQVFVCLCVSVFFFSFPYFRLFFSSLFGCVFSHSKLLFPGTHHDKNTLHIWRKQLSRV